MTLRTEPSSLSVDSAKETNSLICSGPHLLRDESATHTSKESFFHLLFFRLLSFFFVCLFLLIFREHTMFLLCFARLFKSILFTPHLHSSLLRFLLSSDSLPDNNYNNNILLMRMMKRRERSKSQEQPWIVPPVFSSTSLPTSSSSFSSSSALSSTCYSCSSSSSSSSSLRLSLGLRLLSRWIAFFTESRDKNTCKEGRKGLIFLIVILVPLLAPSTSSRVASVFLLHFLLQPPSVPVPLLPFSLFRILLFMLLILSCSLRF